MCAWKVHEIQSGLAQAATVVADELGFEVVEARYMDGPGRARVRVFIDRDPGVSLDDCALYSRRLGARLDLLDVVPRSYDLEISSPGADRPFSTLKQYERSLGKEIVIDLEEPIGKDRRVRGVLKVVTGERLTVSTSEGEVEVAMDMVRRACRALAF